MKKIVFLGCFMVFCSEAISVLPPTFAQSVSDTNRKDSLSVKAPQMFEALNELPLAYRNFVTDVLLNCEKRGNDVIYTLPSGETITMNLDDGYCTEFWKSVIEANKVTEICNVPFGSSYESTKRILEEKFGEYSYILSTKDKLVFERKRYGGIFFDRIYFFFQSDGRKTFFNGAFFILECKTKYEAIDRKNELHELLGKRYINLLNLDNEDDYQSVGGLALIPTDKNAGFGFAIDILKYNEGNSIGKPYCVRIMYGPYDFIKENF